MTFVDEALEANKLAATTYDGEGLGPQPVRHVAVLACMDARLDLFKSLGLAVGACHVLRNAGGRATDDVIRSLAVSSHILETREFLVIHHTDCGLQRLNNDQLRERVQANGADAGDIDFLTIADLTESLEQDVAKIAASQLMLPGIRLTGLIFDVKTGLLDRVCEAVTLGAKSTALP